MSIPHYSDCSDGPSLPDDYIRKVLRFPKVGIHAVANARQGAVSLEEDREATRREYRRAEIRRQIDELNMANAWAELDIARRNDLITTLRTEDQLLEVPRG